MLGVRKKQQAEGIRARGVGDAESRRGAGGERPPAPRSKCTDPLWACGFFAYWVGMCAVALVGLATGDIRRLIFASDYLGNSCGSCVDDWQSCGHSIYYPLGGADFLQMRYGVCVDGCPSAGDFVCTYEVERALSASGAGTGAGSGLTSERQFVLGDCARRMHAASLGAANAFGLDAFAGDDPCKGYMEACWPVAQDQANLLFRCLPEEHLNQSSRLYCYYPRHQDEQGVTRMPATVCPDQAGAATLDESCDDAACRARTGRSCQPNDRCRHVLEETTSFSVRDANSASPAALIAARLGTWTATVARNFGDLQETWFTVVVTGVVGAFALGVLWIYVLERFVGVFVWLMIVLSLGGQVLLVLICFAKAGMLGEQVAVVTSALANNTVVVSALSASSAQQSLWYFLGVVLSVVVIVYALVLLVMRRRIRLAVAVLEEASKAIESLTSVLLMPVFTTLCALVLAVYAAGVFGYVYTAGDKQFQTLEDLIPTLSQQQQSQDQSQSEFQSQSQDQDQDVRRLRSLLQQNVTTVLRTGIDTVVANTSVSALLVFHVFGCLWTLQVLQGVNTLTISHAVSRWYWKRDDGLVSLLTSYRRTLLVHFGTVCFGGLLIAVMQLLRVLVYYVAKQARRLQQDNSVVLMLLRALQSCLWCFEKLLKFVTQAAYVVVGMYGTSFCSSAKRAVGLIVANLGRVGAVHLVARLVSTLSILVVVSACTVLEFVWLENDDAFADSVHSVTLSVVLTGVVSFWVANGFMQVYEVTIDTIMLCFCVDVELNRESKAFYMGPSLRRIFSKSSRRKKGNNKGSKSGESDNKKKKKRKNNNGTAAVVPS